MIKLNPMQNAKIERIKNEYDNDAASIITINVMNPPGQFGDILAPKTWNSFLTWNIQEIILKHQTEYDQAGSLDNYANENPTIEAQIVDFADSLAYVNHDVDDGLKSGCITVEDLMESELWRQALDQLGKSIRHDDSEMLRYQVVKALIDMQVKDFLSHTDSKLNDLNFSSAAWKWATPSRNSTTRWSSAGALRICSACMPLEMKKSTPLMRITSAPWPMACRPTAASAPASTAWPCSSPINVPSVRCCSIPTCAKRTASDL